MIAGDSTAHTVSIANVRPFSIQKREPGVDQGAQKPSHFGASRPGYILPPITHKISSWILTQTPDPGQPSAAIQATSIPMLQYDPGVHPNPVTPTALEAYHLDANGDGIMVTGQLSGCCFCWMEDRTTLWCAHIKPHGTIDGTRLNTLLAVSGRFRGERWRSINTFGRTEYEGVATVIGVRHGRQWKLFAQKSMDYNKTIIEACQLYPGPRRKL